MQKRGDSSGICYGRLAGIFSILELSYKDILQSELDNKLYALALEVSINESGSSSGPEFMRDQFCPQTGTNFLKCDEILIGVQNVTGRTRLTEFTNKSIIGTWELGATDDTLIVELNYPLVDFIHPIAIADVVTVAEKRYYRSRGVIRREPILAGPGVAASAGSGGA